MYPVVDASYLMSSSPPQFRCLNCSASQVCSQDGPLYQVRGTHDCTYAPPDARQDGDCFHPKPEFLRPVTAKLILELQNFIFQLVSPKFPIILVLLHLSI